MRVPWYLMAKGKGGGGYKTASGPIVSINDALAAPLRSLRVGIDPVQAGTGDPSPDNVRPISGWTEANVWRTGKNLLDVGNASGWEVPSGGEIAVSNNAVSIKILGSGGTKYWRSQNITLTGNVTISQKATCNNSRIYIRLRKLDDSGWMTNSDATITGMSYNSYYGGWYTNAGASTTFVKSITIPMCLYWNYGTGFDNASATVGDTETVSDIQLELGSIATAYEPYTGNQYTIQLGQTVYDGTLDVINGVLTVTHKYYENAGTGNWGEVTSGGARYYIGGVSTDAKSDSTNGWSNIGELVSNFQSDGIDVSSNGRINLCGSLHSAFASVEDLKAYLFSNPLQIVYELATPITIPLTATQISLLKGQNTLWADTGDVTVEYLSSGGANPDLMKLAVAFMGRK